MRLNEGQVQAGRVHPLDAPGSLPLPIQRVWVSEFDGPRQTIGLSLPVQIPEAGGTVLAVIHPGMGRRTVQLVQRGGNRVLSQANLNAQEWQLIRLPVAEHDQNIGEYVLVMSGQDPFYLTEAVIAPGTDITPDMMPLTGGALMPLVLQGADGLAGAIGTVQQASGWTWNLWAMSAVARAPRDEADARQTMITEAVARAYERMGRRVRPGVHMGGTSLRRAMEEALAENSGLLLLFAPTGGMVGRDMREFVEFANQRLEQGQICILVLEPDDDASELSPAWNRAVEQARSDQPWLAIIDLHRAVRFAQARGLDLSDDTVRQQTMRSALEGGVFELLSNIARFRR
jgi:hypothetical protein